ncbi:LysR family transcriptional regulator [Variovorax sp. Varisp62]|uniref:LysR family transcriptional regulator n=1 Tax=Variovorax sp. Varisp62 TaxID=3243049 RepID=UPI0039B461C8
MELRHLRVLIAVAEELHFGRAAKRLNLSQPPVSLAIRELEDELGVRLFERTSRHIEITPAGEEALRDARAVLGRTESLREHARNASRGGSGSLSIGFISLAAYSFLPAVLRRFAAEYPGVKIALHESTTDRIPSDVENGSLDVGCHFVSPSLPASLSYRATDNDALVVALPEQHPMAGQKRVSLAKLADEQFLVFERHHGPIMFDTVVSACRQHGFSPRIFPARQMHTIISLVSGGIGVALVPDCVQVMRREGVVYRPLSGERTRIETGVCWRTDDDSPVLRAFLSHLPRIRTTVAKVGTAPKG